MKMGRAGSNQRFLNLVGMEVLAQNWVTSVSTGPWEPVSSKGKPSWPGAGPVVWCWVGLPGSGIFFQAQVEEDCALHTGAEDAEALGVEGCAPAAPLPRGAGGPGLHSMCSFSG